MVLHQVVLQRVPSLTASTIFTIAALNNRNTYFNDEPPSYREVFCFFYFVRLLVFYVIPSPNMRYFSKQTYQPQYAPPPARRYFQLRNQRRKDIFFCVFSQYQLLFFEFLCKICLDVFIAEIGIVLLGVGIMFTFLGMMLFFEKNLLKFGNVTQIVLQQYKHFFINLL